MSDKSQDGQSGARNPGSVVWGYACHIMSHYDEWEEEAGAAAQFDQDDKVGAAVVRGHLIRVLNDLVEESAKVCEGRARCRKDQIPIHNEAIKCADQIRHNLKA